jgi:hypothetical protein
MSAVGHPPPVFTIFSAQYASAISLGAWDGRRQIILNNSGRNNHRGAVTTLSVDSVLAVLEYQIYQSQTLGNDQVGVGAV